MASQTWTISSLFQPPKAMTEGHKDSDVANIITQLNNFKSFGEENKTTTDASSPVTLTFVPSNGSTCLSLYPRTKTFTFHSLISDTACLATSSDSQLWRISALPASSAIETEAENLRFTIERLSSLGGDHELAPVEIFRRCSVTAVPEGGRRASSQDYGRKLSVGHFSSGLSGSMLPLGSIA